MDVSLLWNHVYFKSYDVGTVWVNKFGEIVKKVDKPLGFLYAVYLFYLRRFHINPFLEMQIPEAIREMECHIPKVRFLDDEERDVSSEEKDSSDEEKSMSGENAENSSNDQEEKDGSDDISTSTDDEGQMRKRIHLEQVSTSR